RRVGADHLQKVHQPCAAKAPDNIPSLDADVPRVLPEPGQRLDLRQRVIPWLLHRAANGEGPFFEINSGIVDVVVVNGKFGKGRNLRIGKRMRQVARTEEPGRSPIAETEACLKQRLLELGDSEGSER